MRIWDSLGPSKLCTIDHGTRASYKKITSSLRDDAASYQLTDEMGPRYAIETLAGRVRSMGHAAEVGPRVKSACIAEVALHDRQNATNENQIILNFDASGLLTSRSW
jgi:hypothetical protein